MTAPRRRFLGGLASLIFLIPKSLLGARLPPTGPRDGEIQIDGTLHAGVPIAARVQVFNRDTGELQTMVSAVNIEEGWIDQMQMERFTRNPDDKVNYGEQMGDDRIIWRQASKPAPGTRINSSGMLVKRIYGNWGARLLPEPVKSASSRAIRFSAAS